MSDKISSRGTVNLSMILSTPHDESIDIERNLTDPSTKRLNIPDGGKRCTLPILERIVECVTIVGHFDQAMPGLAGIPSEPDLRVG